MVTRRDAPVLLAVLFLCWIIDERLWWDKNCVSRRRCHNMSFINSELYCIMHISNTPPWTGADTRRLLGRCSQTAGHKPAQVSKLFRHKPVTDPVCHRALVTPAQSRANTVIYTRNGSSLASPEGGESNLPATSTLRRVQAETALNTPDLVRKMPTAETEPVKGAVFKLGRNLQSLLWE